MVACGIRKVCREEDCLVVVKDHGDRSSKRWSSSWGVRRMSWLLKEEMGSGLI